MGIFKRAYAQCTLDSRMLRETVKPYALADKILFKVKAYKT